MGNRWKQGTVRVWKTMFQNVSYLGFDLPHQNLQWVQYAWSFMELKGKTAWQGSPPGSRNRLSFWLSFFFVSYWGPCKLSHSSPADSFEWTSPANHAEQHGDFAHLASFAQTNKPKTAETHASCCLTKGSLETSTILDALHVYNTPLRAHEDGRTFLPPKRNLPLKADSQWLSNICSPYIRFSVSRNTAPTVKVYKEPIKYLPNHLYNGRKGQS